MHEKREPIRIISVYLVSNPLMTVNVAVFPERLQENDGTIARVPGRTVPYARSCDKLRSKGKPRDGSATGLAWALRASGVAAPASPD